MSNCLTSLGLAVRTLWTVIHIEEKNLESLLRIKVYITLLSKKAFLFKEEKECPFFIVKKQKDSDNSRVYIQMAFCFGISGKRLVGI